MGEWLEHRDSRRVFLLRCSFLLRCCDSALGTSSACCQFPGPAEVRIALMRRRQVVAEKRGQLGLLPLPSLNNVGRPYNRRGTRYHPIPSTEGVPCIAQFLIP